VECVLSLVYPWLRLRFFRKLFCWKEEQEDAEKWDDRRAMVDPKDRFKTEFAIPKEIIEMMYRQALIWSGAPFSPVLPILGIFTTAILISVKAAQVRYLTRPPVRPMGVAKQNRYFRTVMVVTLTICIIPYSFFLRRIPTCGPHMGDTPINIFFVWIETLPAWFAFIFAYVRNVVLLWLLLTLLIIYGVYLSKKKNLLIGELAMLRLRLKMEVKEKRVIIRENGIRLDNDQERGKFMFREWMQGGDLTKFAERYSRKLQDSYFDDLLELVKLQDHEIETLMVSWRTEEFPVPDDHITFFKKKTTDTESINDLIATTEGKLFVNNCLGMRTLPMTVS